MKFSRLYIIALIILILFPHCTEEPTIFEPNPYDSDVVFDPNAPEISEEWVAWIKENSFEIAPPDSESFSDLDFLKELIKDKEIVQLGESCHGVKEFNASKVRLIKYLHEEMNFNIIAFESSIFDCYYSYNNELKNGALSAMQNSIFDVWYTREVIELFEYIIESQNTENPLILSGIDIQPSSIGQEKRPQFLKEVFSTFDLHAADSIYKLDSSLQAIRFNENYNLLKDHYIEAYNYFADLLDSKWDAIVNAYGENLEIPLIAKIAIRSNIKFIDEIYYNNLSNMVGLFDMRDPNMAYNCEFLRNNIYPNEKMIIWAHNGHIRYDNKNVTGVYFEKINTMGFYLKEMFESNIYTIGFYMYSGSVANNDGSVVAVQPSSAENIEAILYTTLYQYAFIDLFYQNKVPGNSWMFDEMKVKFWGGDDQTMIVKDQYDALFYVYKANPPDYISFVN